MRSADTACPLDCPDGCTAIADIDGDRLIRLRGDRRNPMTAGYVCGKVGSFGRLVHGDDRALYPQIRLGPKGSRQFRRASWDEALDRVTSALADLRSRHGGESILPCNYGGSNGFLTQGVTDERLLRRLGATRLQRTLCAAPTGRAQEGLSGRMPGVPLSDYVDSKLIVLWGVHPAASGVHLVPLLKQAQERGARLVVVDPRSTGLARRAALHLPLRPGTDLPVALAVLRELFAHGADHAFLARWCEQVDELQRRVDPWTPERAAAAAGVDPGAIRALAAMWRDSSPAVVRLGWGVERSRCGGSASIAILAMALVGGKFGVRGGGYTGSLSGAWKLNLEPAIGEPPAATRSVNQAQLGDALRPDGPGGDGRPVRALLVYNCNPVATVPDQGAVLRGLLREDLLTVVHEQVWTDTCDFADVVLPATTFVEHDELKRSYGSMVLTRARPVLAPRGEARDNHTLFTDLTRRLGLEKQGDATTHDAVVAAILNANPAGQAASRHLDEAGVAFPLGKTAPQPLRDVFPATPDGRFHLVPAALDVEAGPLYGWAPVPEDDRYPLALISPASHHAISSTLAQYQDDMGRLEMHPADAEARGIRAGDVVRIWNERGEVHCRVLCTDTVRPGVLSLPKGLWRKHTENGFTANALIPQTVADLGGGACYNDARVQAERWSGAPSTEIAC